MEGEFFVCPRTPLPFHEFRASVDIRGSEVVLDGRRGRSSVDREMSRETWFVVARTLRCFMGSKSAGARE